MSVFGLEGGGGYWKSLDIVDVELKSGVLMVNRDRHEITIEILENARSGKNETELMRDANLSYAQAKLYLRNLVEKELLETGVKRHYVTTKRGLEFLDKCGDCPLLKWRTRADR